MERFAADGQKDEGFAKLVQDKAADLKSLSTALIEHGYEATDDEIKAFVQAQAKKQNKELSDEDLVSVEDILPDWKHFINIIRGNFNWEAWY